MVAESEAAEALREALHVASLDPPRWPDALRDLARFVAGPEARAVGALTLIEGPAPGTGWLLAGIDDEVERAYPLGEGARHPLFRDASTLPEGFVGASDLLADPKDLARSTLAREHLRDDGTIHGTSAVLVTDPFVAAVHVLGRRGGGAWSDDAAARLRAVTPSLRRAVQVYVRLRHLRATARIDDAMLDRLDVAALALHPSGRVLRANASARALLSRGDGIAEDDGGLRCTRPSAHDALRSALATVVTRGAPEVVVIAPRPSGRRPLLLFVSALRDPDTQAPLAVTVLARDAAPQGRRVEDLLRTIFSLTPTEARLALAVAEGSTPAEAAELLGMSVLTARTHLKRIFHKTATTRQAELVRLVQAEFPPVTPT